MAFLLTKVTAIARGILARSGLALLRASDAVALRQAKIRAEELALFFEFLRELDPEKVGMCLPFLGKSHAQLHQDLFVLSQLNFKRDGFFVEFGATNGVDLSNSYLLETEFGWQGILAEPARRWRPELEANRRASLDFDCVWSDTGKVLSFREADQGEYSTIESFKNSDDHLSERLNGRTYDVTTVSLRDLLIRHNAPRLIDYLSIDTEGSEFDIIKEFDFTEFRFSVITVEHNFNANRQRIFDLLNSHGYRRASEGYSRFDDWYVAR